LLASDVRELHQNVCTREEEYVRSALELGILIAKERHHEKCDSNVGFWFPAHKSVFYGSFEADSLWRGDKFQEVLAVLSCPVKRLCRNDVADFQEVKHRQ
jgi:hypothetical protein